MPWLAKIGRDFFCLSFLFLITLSLLYTYKSRGLITAGESQKIILLASNFQNLQKRALIKAGCAITFNMVARWNIGNPSWHKYNERISIWNAPRLVYKYTVHSQCAWKRKGSVFVCMTLCDLNNNRAVDIPGALCFFSPFILVSETIFNRNFRWAVFDIYHAHIYIYTMEMIQYLNVRIKKWRWYPMQEEKKKETLRGQNKLHWQHRVYKCILLPDLYILDLSKMW